jgi:hypothetical protein
VIDVYAPPKASIDPQGGAVNLRAWKWACLAFIAALTFAFGALSWHFQPDDLPPVLDWPIFFLVAAATFCWYVLDARQRGYRRSRWLDIALIVLGGLAMAYYLVRSRGWKRGVLAIVLMLLFVGLCIALSGAGAMAVVVWSWR